MGDWDLQKKALLPYLQRAAEIEAVDPKVAYYCRLYAVEQGIKLEQRDKRAEDLLELVLNQLEKDKPHLVLDTSADLGHCERFALSVYIKAKRRDEQGNSDRDTAKAYYAAFNFIEILKQFGQLSPEVERERRFAVFRAAEIKRCLDEGKQPPPLVPSAQTNADGTEAAVDAPPSETAGPPLIDYDPGYVIGSRVLFMDGESGLFRKGFIRGRATEVGGFFNIEAEDGSERQLGALFLAPDLSNGGEVTYFFPDGRQMDGMATDMSTDEWPPTYTIKLEDGTTRSIPHSQFVLNSGPMTAEESRNLDEALEASQSTLSVEPVAISADDSAVTGPGDGTSAPIGRRSSWLKPKSSSKSTDKFAFSQTPTVPEGAGSGTPVSEGEHPMVSATPPSRYPAGLPAYPLTPSQYYNEYPDDVATAEENPTVEVVNYSVVEQQPAESTRPCPEVQLPVVIERQLDYMPDAVAMQQAARSAQNATTALNFSDAQRAIHFLQDALKQLTVPNDLSSS